MGWWYPTMLFQKVACNLILRLYAKFCKHIKNHNSSIFFNWITCSHFFFIFKNWTVVIFLNLVVENFRKIFILTQLGSKTKKIVYCLWRICNTSVENRELKAFKYIVLTMDVLYLWIAWISFRLTPTIEKETPITNEDRKLIELMLALLC